jgi:hypothetical protein
MSSATPRASTARVTIENVNVPGRTTVVDAAMYEAMRAALMTVLPDASPGLTQTEIRAAVQPHLPQDLYPQGAKAEWWSKAVQLDLEAKGVMVRDGSRPIRWHRTRS